MRLHGPHRLPMRVCVSVCECMCVCVCVALRQLFCLEAVCQPYQHLAHFLVFNTGVFGVSAHVHARIHSNSAQRGRGQSRAVPCRAVPCLCTLCPPETHTHTHTHRQRISVRLGDFRNVSLREESAVSATCGLFCEP